MLILYNNIIETFIRQSGKLTEINYHSLHNTGSIHTLSTAWNLSTTLFVQIGQLHFMGHHCFIRYVGIKEDYGQILVRQ